MIVFFGKRAKGMAGGASNDHGLQQPQVPYGSYSSCGDKVYTLKFVLVGSRGVGKSRLASLFHKKQGGCPSVGMQFATRTLRYGERSSVRAQVLAKTARLVCACVYSLWHAMPQA